MPTEVAIRNRMFACIDWPSWSKYTVFYHYMTKSGRHRIRFGKQILSGRSFEELHEKVKRFAMIDHLCGCAKAGVTVDYVPASKEDM